MKAKEFFKRWGEGINNIPPDQLLFSEMLGFSGSILGSIFAALFFIFIVKTMWVIAIPLAFGVLIQVSQLMGKYQQYSAMKNLKTQLQDLNFGGKNGL